MKTTIIIRVMTNEEQEKLVDEFIQAMTHILSLLPFVGSLDIEKED